MSGMTCEQMRDLATEVAGHLTVLRGVPWTVAQCDTDEGTWPGAQLAAAVGGFRLQLRYGWEAAGKVTITGLFPGEWPHAVYRANVDPARGAAVIAKEAARRVLDAGYLTELPAVQQKEWAHQRREQARLELLTFAAGMVGAPAPDSPDGRIDLAPLISGGWGDATVRWDGISMDISLTGVPAEVALRVLAALAGKD